MKELKLFQRTLPILFLTAMALTCPITVQAQTRQQLINTLLSPLAKGLDKSLAEVPMKLNEALAIISEAHKLKGVFAVDRNAFKAQNPDAPNVLDTEVRFPRLRNVRLATAVQVALDQCVVPAYFRVENKRIVIFPGYPPPLRDKGGATKIRNNLLKKMSLNIGFKVKLGEAVALLSDRGDFTILISKHFRMENPDAPDMRNREVTLPNYKNASVWKFLANISKQVGAVPVVLDDHVMLATPAQLRFPPGGKRPVLPALKLQ